MKKNSLTPNKGLSLSQAQSISNLCNQRAREIDAKLNAVNNYSKSVDIFSNGEIKTHFTVVGKPLPAEIVSMLTEKAKLSACQAFLMENIKAKDGLLTQMKSKIADTSAVVVPDKPKFEIPLQLPKVEENWGWEQLSTAEINEFIEAESYAAHIGQFIHKDGLLDSLRKELPRIEPIEWMTIKDGEKSPVIVRTHHTAEKLHAIHEEFAAIHRTYEQRVNYFKAKVKNLVTVENARIANINADAQNEAAKITNELQAAYETAYRSAAETIKNIQTEFEKERQANIKEIAAMRISIDSRFQETIDMFLKQISDVQE
jgi:predicted phage tail protein